MMTRKQNCSLRILLIAPCLILLAINIQAQKTSFEQNNDHRDVRAALDRLVDGFNRRDAQAVISSFAEDAYIINPTRGVSDYKNLSEGLAKTYAEPAKNPFAILINVEEIQTSGDLAFVRLIWLRERNTDKAIVSKEKDLEIWRRENDGKWKLSRGYSYYFKEDYPLVPLTALAKSKRAASPPKGKKSPPNQAKDVEAVKSALDKLVASYNNRDLDTTMSLYASDSLLSHDGIADTNRDEARQAYAKRFANPPSFPITISYQTEEIQTSGDLAFARLIWLVERKSDKKILSRNKDLEIWQRQKDGSWKLIRGIGFYLKPEDKNTEQKEKDHNGFSALKNIKPYLLALSVPDLDGATEWYQEKLEFTVTKRINLPEYSLRINFLELNGFRIELIENKKSFSIKKHVPDYKESTALLQGAGKFAFLVDDAESVAATLKNRGVRFEIDVKEDKEFGVKFFIIADNNGNLIQFFQKLN